MDYKGEDAHILDTDFVKNSCSDKLEFKASCSTKSLPEKLGLWNCLSYWQLYGEIRMSPRNKAIKPPTENNYLCFWGHQNSNLPTVDTYNRNKAWLPPFATYLFSPPAPMLTSDLTNKVLFFFSYSLIGICKPSFSYT